MLVLFLGTLLCYKSLHDELSVIGEVPVQIRMGNRRKNRIQRKTLKNQAKEVGINRTSQRENGDKFLNGNKFQKFGTFQ